MRIYNWEMAEGWQTMSKIFTQHDFDDVDEFAPVLAKLQNAGLLHSGLDQLLQFSTAIFTVALYLALPSLYKTLMPSVDFSSSAELAHCPRVCCRFCCAWNSHYTDKGKA